MARAESAPAIDIVGTSEEEKEFLKKCKELRLSNNHTAIVYRQFRKFNDVDVEGLCDTMRGQHSCPRKYPPGPCSVSTDHLLPCCHLLAVRRHNSEELLTAAMVAAARGESAAVAGPAHSPQPPQNNPPENDAQSRPESPGTKLARRLLRLGTGGSTTPSQGDGTGHSSQQADASDRTDRDTDSDGDDEPGQRRAARRPPVASGAATPQGSNSQAVAGPSRATRSQTSSRRMLSQGGPSSQQSDVSDRADRDMDTDKPVQKRAARQPPASSVAVTPQGRNNPDTSASGPAGPSRASGPSASSPSASPRAKGGSRLRDSVDTATVQLILDSGRAVLQHKGPCTKQTWLLETMTRVGDRVKNHINKTKATFTATQMFGEVFALGIRQGLWEIREDKITLR